MRKEYSASRKVVIIDSNLKIQQVLKEFLEEEGYEVHSAYSAVEGIRLVKTSKPDAAIFDLILPVKDGIQMLKELGADAETSDIPKIILSNIDDKEKMREALDAGAAGYLIKSRHKLKEILNEVERIINQRETEASLPAGKRPLIAMFNDDEFLLGIFENIFRRKGYDFKGFNAIPLSGVAKVIGATLPAAIIVDLVMCFDGIKVIGAFRAQSVFGQVPIVVLDNISNEAEIQKAKETGANEYISLKDFNPSQAADRIIEIICQTSKK